MEYSIEFNPKFNHKEDVQEYSIKFTGDYVSLRKFLEIMKAQEPDKRIKIKFPSEYAADLDPMLLSPYSQMILLEVPYELTYEPNMEIINKIKEYNIKFFLDLFVCDWCTLRGVVDLGVSDVKVSGELGFDLEEVHDYLQECGVRVRVCPDVAQSPWEVTPLPPHMYFYVRPEDIDAYAPFIDVLYFNHENQIVIYEVYAIRKQWFGDLRGIIGTFFDEPLDNRAVLPIYGENRINCKMRCKYGRGCHKCSTINHFSEVLTENGLFIS